MMIIVQQSWRCTGLILMATMVASVQPASAQQESMVKELQARYQAEREKILRDGIARKFSPALLEKADELAQAGAKAITDGRLAQAAENFRLARWQLPYAPEGAFPDHLAWVAGNFRLRHDGDVTAVAYSPDGRLLASAGSDRSIKIWDLGNGHEVLTYSGHSEPARAMIFSPDGKMIASAQPGPFKGDGVGIRLWDAATGKDIHILPGKVMHVTALAFSSDSKFLLAAGAAGPNHVVTIHDTTTGKPRTQVEDFRAPVSSIRFNSAGTLLAVGTGGPGEIRLYSFPDLIGAAKPAPYWTKLISPAPVQQLAISPDDRHIACLSIYDLRLFALPRPDDKTPVDAPSQVISHATSGGRHLCFVFSKDGKRLFVGGTDGAIRVHQVASGQQIESIQQHTSPIAHMVINPAGNQLAAPGPERSIRLWDVAAAEEPRDFVGHKKPIATASFSPDGARVVSASADRSVKVWDATTGKALHDLNHGAAVTAALFSPDGKIIASAGGDKIIKLWDAASGKPLREFEGHTATITALDFVPDGKETARLVSGSVDRQIKVWDLRTGKETLTIDNGVVVAALAVSPDGRHIAAGNVDQSIKIFDAGAGKLHASWTAHDAAINGLAYSPDGRFLASCGNDKLVHLWPTATPGKDNTALKGHRDAVSAVAFHKDSNVLVSSGSDADIKFWSVQGPAAGARIYTAREQKSLRGHADWVTSLAFSKDGRFLVSAGVEGVAKVWEIVNRPKALALEHTGTVVALAVSADGKHIATGAADRTSKIWDCASGAHRFTLTEHAGAVTAVTFAPDSKSFFTATGERKFPFALEVDRVIKQWDCATGAPLPFSLSPPAGRPPQTAPGKILFGDGGKRFLIWGTYDGGYTDLIGWEAAGGKYLFRFNDVYRPTHNIAFSADARFLATGGGDASIRVFDFAKGFGIPVYDHLWHIFPKEQPGAIALTPDGSHIIYGNGKGAVRIGKVAGKQPLETFQAHDGRVSCCVVSPDGKRLATAGGDNLVKLWDLANRTELRRWSLRGAGQVSSNLLAFTPDGKQLVTTNGDSALLVLDLP